MVGRYLVLRDPHRAAVKAGRSVGPQHLGPSTDPDGEIGQNDIGGISDGCTEASVVAGLGGFRFGAQIRPPPRRGRDLPVPGRSG
jgi:hypothetical protein